MPKLTVITQNVDDLHERAGSVGVLHLYGSLHSSRCSMCGQPHRLPLGIPDEPDGGRRLRQPRCSHCGDSVRPGVVWFVEELPAGALDHAFAAARDCDLLFAIGTSGLVQPAAGIPSLARQAGTMVVQVKPMITQLDDPFTWKFRGAAGVVMPNFLQETFPSASVLCRNP